MTEPELTPDLAATLFGGTAKPEDKPDESTAAQTTGQAAPIAPPPEPEPELTGDQAELAERYGLDAETVKRVRGQSWSEKCEDAERLSKLTPSNPNVGELRAFAAKDQANRDLIERVHGKPPE